MPTLMSTERVDAIRRGQVTKNEFRQFLPTPANLLLGRTLRADAGLPSGVGGPATWRPAQLLRTASVAQGEIRFS